MDSAIGLFLNTVPVRVDARSGRDRRATCCARIQDQRTALMPHEYLGLGELQQAAGHAPLFDTLFVLQNFVDADGFAALGDRHGITDASGVDATHYPLTLVVTPGPALRGQARVPARRVRRRRRAVLPRPGSPRSSTGWPPIRGARVGRLDLLLPASRRRRRPRSGPPTGTRCRTSTVADLLAVQAAAHAGRARRWSSATRRSPTPSWTRGSTGWPGCCSPAAPARRRSSRSRCPGRSRWSWRCSRCCGPVPPTCRWTSTTRPTGCA